MKRFSYFSLLFVFALASVVLGCQAASTTGANNAATPGNAVANTSTNANANASPAAPVDDAPRISLADAKAAFDSGEALFIDTRAAAAYDQEHIKGAMNISAGTLGEKIGQLPKDKKLIAYCS